MAAKKTKTKKQTKAELERAELEQLAEQDEKIVQILSHLIRRERLPRKLQPYFRQPFMLFALTLLERMRKAGVELDQAERVAREWVADQRSKHTTA